MKAARILIELHAPDGNVYRYDAFSDGPLNQWLESVVPKLPADFNQLYQNATIRVWPRNG